MCQENTNKMMERTGVGGGKTIKSPVSAPNSSWQRAKNYKHLTTTFVQSRWSIIRDWIKTKGLITWSSIPRDGLKWSPSFGRGINLSPRWEICFKSPFWNGTYSAPGKWHTRYKGRSLTELVTSESDWTTNTDKSDPIWIWIRLAESTYQTGELYCPSKKYEVHRNILY